MIWKWKLILNWTLVFLYHLYLQHHGYIKDYISKGEYLFCQCLLQVLNVSAATDETNISCTGLILTPEGLTNSTFRAFSLSIDSSRNSRSASKFVSIIKNLWIHFVFKNLRDISYFFNFFWGGRGIWLLTFKKLFLLLLSTIRSVLSYMWTPLLYVKVYHFFFTGISCLIVTLILKIYCFSIKPSLEITWICALYVNLEHIYW